MAAAPQHVRREADPRPYHDADLVPVVPPRPRSRHLAARRARLGRVFVVFVCALTVLAVGRVALSFAVVQKTLQTEALVREERRVTLENTKRQEQVAQLASTVRIKQVAESRLGLVEPQHVTYVQVGARGAAAEVAAGP